MHAKHRKAIDEAANHVEQRERWKVRWETHRNGSRHLYIIQFEVDTGMATYRHRMPWGTNSHDPHQPRQAARQVIREVRAKMEARA